MAAALRSGRAVRQEGPALHISAFALALAFALVFPFPFPLRPLLVASHPVDDVAEHAAQHASLAVRDAVLVLAAFGPAFAIGVAVVFQRTVHGREPLPDELWVRRVEQEGRLLQTRGREDSPPDFGRLTLRQRRAEDQVVGFDDGAEHVHHDPEYAPVLGAQDGLQVHSLAVHFPAHDQQTVDDGVHLPDWLDLALRRKPFWKAACGDDGGTLVHALSKVVLRFLLLRLHSQMLCTAMRLRFTIHIFVIFLALLSLHFSRLRHPLRGCSGHRCTLGAPNLASGRGSAFRGCRCRRGGPRGLLLGVCGGEVHIRQRQLGVDGSTLARLPGQRPVLGAAHHVLGRRGHPLHR
mmetsp:Transcript_79288/g.256985  ORF Transcript_79288/g.256985 Transcript_79288/m.256985 type:complete len:350 (-) Transcript_79288:471-1520(-)